MSGGGCLGLLGLLMHETMQEFGGGNITPFCWWKWNKGVIFSDRRGQILIVKIQMIWYKMATMDKVGTKRWSIRINCPSTGTARLVPVGLGSREFGCWLVSLFSTTWDRVIHACLEPTEQSEEEKNYLVPLSCVTYLPILNPFYPSIFSSFFNHPRDFLFLFCIGFSLR